MKKIVSFILFFATAILQYTPNLAMKIEEEVMPEQFPARWERDWKIGEPKPDQDWWKNKGQKLIERNKFIDDLIGQSEKEFRKENNWGTKKYNYPSPVSKNPRSVAAIDDGTHHISNFDVTNFETFYKNNPNFAKKIQKGKGHLHILVRDPYYPWETDIRYLQALPSNKGALFQIASTFFGPLEGGMAPGNALLTTMAGQAAQGEEASIATAGATFIRKYDSQPFYLLWAFGKGLKIINEYRNEKGEKKQEVVKPNSLGQFTAKSGKVWVDNDDVKSYAYQIGDEQLVGFGLHERIAVTSGYGDRGATGEQQRLPIFTAVDEKAPSLFKTYLDLNKTQYVSHFLCSALDLRFVNPKDAEKNNMEAAAKMILRADYSNIILQAAHLKIPKVWLTLMGASVFRNDIRWIPEAMNQDVVKDYIRTSHLDAYLIYRPDPGKETRSDQKDIEFFLGDDKGAIGMLQIMDRINKSKLSNDEELKNDLRKYINLLYEIARNEDLVHQYAVRINIRLMQLSNEKLPEIKERPMPTPTPKPTPTPTIKPPAPTPAAAAPAAPPAPTIKPPAPTPPAPKPAPKRGKRSPSRVSKKRKGKKTGKKKKTSKKKKRKGKGRRRRR